MNENVIRFVPIGASTLKNRLKNKTLSVLYKGEGKFPSYTVTINAWTSEFIVGKFKCCRVAENTLTGEIFLVFDNCGEGFHVSACGTKKYRQNAVVNGKSLIEYLLKRFGYEVGEQCKKVVLSCSDNLSRQNDCVTLLIKKLEN